MSQSIYPGSIQLHGVLLALLEDDFTIVQLSANTSEYFKIAPEELLDKNLDVLFQPAQIDHLRNSLTTYNLEKNPLYLFTTTIKGGTEPYDVIAHRIDNGIVLELERSASLGNDPYFQLRTAFNQLAAASNLDKYYNVLAQQVQQLTGFDRVMVYKFDEDGHGTVIAEAKKDAMSAFLGLHYPASDIPRQARALYLVNWLRQIPDVTYTPIQIVPTDNILTGKPLDQSYSSLRSVSPIHLQYLKNMGVGASMSISVVKDNDLWGLVACHHETPRYLPYQVRASCELLAQTVSIQLGEKIENENQSYRTHLKTVLNQLVEYMVSHEDYQQALFSYQPNLANFIEAGGAAFYSEDEYNAPTIISQGQLPSAEQLKTLVDWLEETQKREVFYSNNLPKVYQPALEFKDVGSGVLALCLSHQPHQYILWFRPEVVQTVNWAGNPNKPVEWKDGEAILTPRKSFELWKEQLSNHSTRWQTVEIEAAHELRRAIISVVLRRLDELSRLGVMLEQQKAQLAAMEAVEEIELKAPLRSLQSHLSSLLQGYNDRLAQDDQKKLEALPDMLRLTDRMESLLDALLDFSRLGHTSLQKQPTDLNQLASGVIKQLAEWLKARDAEVTIVEKLPTLDCDSQRIEELFRALITNAVKFNQQAHKTVQIGFEAVPGDKAVGRFWVRDEGIGIAEKDFEQIFWLFKRLQPSDTDNEGGTGLSRAKRIVELHGGRIWLTSKVGEGSTFFFTLQKELAWAETITMRWK